MKLLYIILKNLKLVFRSWRSLFLLIIGPLLLITIVGFAFSGDALHDIKIGVYAKDYTYVDNVLGNLATEEVEIIKYQNLDICIKDLKLNKIHLCTQFSDDFKIKSLKEKDITIGDITFYYDNSRYTLISPILDYVQDKIGITSQQITLEATKTILSDIEESVVFMKETQFKLNDFIQQAKGIKEDLINTRDTLVEINAKFDEKYIKIKEAQKKVNDNIDLVNSTAQLLLDNTTQLEKDIISIEQDLDNIIFILNKTNLPKIPILTIQINTTTNDTIAKLDSFRAKLEYYRIMINSTNTKVSFISNQTIALANEFNMLVRDIDEIKEFLNTTIEKTEKNIIVLDNAIADMEEINNDLSESIDKFSGLSQQQADALLKPINTFFNPLLGKMEKIYLIFPILLVFVISFISILLSNMAVLNETHSMAHFRDFLVPVRNIWFILGSFATNMIVVLFQIVILLIIAYTRFGIDFMPVLPILMIAIVLVSTIFILTGMIFGYIIKQQQSSIILCTFISLGIFLFSDVIFPSETMPKIAAFFVNINPLVIGERMFRKIIYYNIPLDRQAADIGILIGYIILLCVLVVYAQKANKKKS